MGRIRALILTLLGVALTALVALTLPDRSAGSAYNFSLGGVLFFGACTLVGASFLIPANIPDPDADGSVTVLNSKPRALIMALALFAVTAAAILIWPAVANDASWKKYAFLAIPAPCGLLGLMYTWWGLSGSPAYKFDKEGVTRYQWGQRRTPWSVVTGVRTIKVRGTENIVLDVTPEHRQSASGISKLGAAAGFGDVSLPVGATGLAPRDIEALVLRFLKPVGLQR